MSTNFTALAEENSPPAPSPDQEAEIATLIQRYQDFRQYMQSKDGAKAADFLSQASFAYYADCLLFANDRLNTNPNYLPTLKIFLILQMRYYIPPEDLITLTARDYFIWGVTHDLISPEVLNPLNIHSVRFKETMDEALCTLRSEDNLIGNMTLSWVKEGDDWKLHFHDILKTMEPVFHKQQRQLRLDKATYAKYLLHRQTNSIPSLPSPAQ